MSRRSSGSARTGPSSCIRRGSTASWISARTRRARTCRASRRSSTTRSARWSSESRRCAPRPSPSTSPRRCETGTRRLVGVRAQGMTACPCAQVLVETRARERLADDGFDDEQIAQIFDAVPVATHNQRGLGTLHIGCPEDCRTDIDAKTLLAIVEDSMSSDIYELMKRSDEGAVVEKAHRRPRFVEDCVREMVRGVVERLPILTSRHFVSARQENLETIHQHNVTAERFGLVGEMRRELHTGEHSEHHVSMREWLDGLA